MVGLTQAGIPVNEPADNTVRIVSPIGPDLNDAECRLGQMSEPPSAGSQWLLPRC